MTALPDRAAAETVLGKLIDARLLTSWETEATEGQPAHDRVEIVHESLLSAWPRLVRWQTQDADGAQLRDQLRQAAHLWEERGKADDLLWTGSSYLDYRVWRGRYPGKLSSLEESFAASMAALSERKRRRRRIAYAAVLAAVVLTAAGLGTMWRKSARETLRADAEAARAEAGKLLSLGRLKLADFPNAAIAYAIGSLERSDNDPARRFAVEALWQGPPALFLKDRILYESDLEWSPDGRWVANNDSHGLALMGKDTNERRQLASASERILGFTADSRRLVTRAAGGQRSGRSDGRGRRVVNVRALPEGRLDQTVELAEKDVRLLLGDRLLTFTFDARVPRGERPALVRRLSLDGKTQEVLGRWEPHGLAGWTVDPTGSWIFSVQRGRLLQQRFDALSAPGRLLGTREGEAVDMRARPWRDRFVTGDGGGTVKIWDVPSARLERTLKSPADARMIALDPRKRFLATAPGTPSLAPRSMFLFDLAAPRTAEPTPLLNESDIVAGMRFSADGTWLASEHGVTAILWNTAGARSTVVGRQEPPSVTVDFTRDGHLLSGSDSGVLRRWPLSPAAGEDVRELVSAGSGRRAEGAIRLAGVDPGGRFAVAARYVFGEILVVPLDGSRPSVHQLRQRGEGQISFGTSSLDASGRFLAAWAPYVGKPELNAIRILDLTTGDVRTLDAHAKGEGGCDAAQLAGSPLAAGHGVPVWLNDGRLVSDGEAGLRVWDLATGTSRQLRPCTKTSAPMFLLATPDSRTVVRVDWTAAGSTANSTVNAFDLSTLATREIPSHGNRVGSFALDAGGTVLVTGGTDGVVRVGPLTGEEPHLLYGHTGPVFSVAVSPDGRWIASGSEDGTIRLWPMPDLSKPPLHTLPHDELLAKLKSLTNLRAVRDPASDTGWKIEIGPFPGWQAAPQW